MTIGLLEELVSRSIRTALAAATAALALGASAAPAAAATAPYVPYTCAFPLVGNATVDFAIVGAGSGYIVIAQSEPAKDGESTWASLKAAGAVNLGGWLTTKLNVTGGSDPAGHTQFRSLWGVVGAYPDPVGFRSDWLDGPRAASILDGHTVTPEGFSMSMTAWTLDGHALTGFSAAQSTPDSDGDAATFDVDCTLAAGQTAPPVTRASDGLPPYTTQPVRTPAPTPPPTPTPEPTPTPTPPPDRSGTYTCHWPLLGDLQGTISSDLPGGTTTGVPLPPASVSFTFEQPARAGLGLFKAASAETASVEGGLTLTPGSRSLPYSPGPVTIGGAVVTFGLITPGFTLTALHPVAVNATSTLVLHERLFKADGSPVVLGTLVSPEDDLDGDLSTLDVPCDLNPGKAQISSIDVYPVPTPTPSPTPPVTPTPPAPPTGTGTYTCDFPLAGKVQGTIATNFPTTVQVGRTINAPGLSLSLGREARAAFDLFKATSAEAKSVQGGVDVNQAGGATVAVDAKPNGRVLVADTIDVALPASAFALTQPGAAKVVARDTFGLHLVLREADGTIVMPESLVSIDTDGDPTTIDIACARNQGRGVVGTVGVIAPTPTPDLYHEHITYGVAGQATLKTLVRGPITLSGSLAATVSVVAFDGDGDLTLGQTNAKLVALGFLPVMAKVSFVSQGRAHLTIGESGKPGRLSATVRIKLPSISLFGLQLAGGSNCQTRSPSSLSLSGGFASFHQPSASFTGTFAISDLTGCGALNGLASSLTAGTGNAIALKLTPAA